MSLNLQRVTLKDAQTLLEIEKTTKGLKTYFGYFTEEEISAILREFYRVLKPRGRVLLFWPPEFGLSVSFMKIVNFILNNILKKNIKLHPDEVTRIQSKKHGQKMLEKDGFVMVDYYFGIKDAFTHVVLTAEKGALDR